MDHPFQTAPNERMIVDNDYALTVKMFFWRLGVWGRGCFRKRLRTFRHEVKAGMTIRFWARKRAQNNSVLSAYVVQSLLAKPHGCLPIAPQSGPLVAHCSASACP